MNQFARPGLAVTELPSFNENDKGKVLKIDSETGVLGWGEAGGSGLPSTDTASAGDVLSLDNSKDPQWSAPSSGGGVLVVHQDENGVLDKTWQEIHDAGVSVVLVEDGSNVIVGYSMSVNGRSWLVAYANTELDGTTYVSKYVASSADGYPVYTE